MDDVNLSALAKTPALGSPPGVSPNFTDHYSLRPFQVATASICVSTATLVIAARFVTKVAISNCLRLEEWTFDLQGASIL